MAKEEPMASDALCENDLGDILSILDGGVNSRWDKLGRSLKLCEDDIECIDRDKDTQEDKLVQVLRLWLRDSLISSGYGPPTWQILIKAVKSKSGGRNPPLAKKIAAAKLGITQVTKNEESTMTAAADLDEPQIPTSEESVMIAAADAKPSETHVPITDGKSGKKTKGKPKTKKRKTSNPKVTKPAVDTDKVKDTPAVARLVIPAQPVAPVATTQPTTQARPERASIQRPSVGTIATTCPQPAACRILLFRISLYLGAIFDGVKELYRRHKRDVHVETYKIVKNGGTLQIVDTFGPEIRERDENICRILPDSILFCLPLTADTKTVKLERDTIEKMKKLLGPEIFKRAVIALTIPKGLSEEELETKYRSRRSNLEASFEKYQMPPVVCISENLIGSVPGYPEWYSQLWLEIFKSCSKEGLPIMAQYLADRMTDKDRMTVPKHASDLLRPIPTEACNEAKWLIGHYHIEKALTTSKSD